MSAEAKAIPILPARDVAGSIVFYELLGLVCTFQQPAPHGYAILRAPAGDLEVHLFLHATLDPAENYAGCYWRVPDVDTIYRQAEAAGLKPRPIPAAAHWGMREFHLLDPSNNLIRIGSPLGN